MSIPSFKPVILYQQIRKDGSCVVKMRITHKRRSKYIPTTVTVFKGDYDKQYNLKNHVIIRMKDLLEDIAEIIESKNIYEWELYDVEEVCNCISEAMKPKEKFYLDFFEWGEQVMAKKSAGTAQNYHAALKAFESFLGTRVLDIGRVTSSLMRKFESYLVDKHGHDARAVSLYTSTIATIHTAARRTFNSDETDEIYIRNPFDYYIPPKQKPALKRTIEFDVIQKLINLREHLDEYYKLAVDVYLLSFCLMGTNVPDIYAAKRDKDIIYYNRAKTKDRRYDKAEMRIRLEPICSCVVSDLIDNDGKRAFLLYKKYDNYKSIADKANKRLKEIAKIIGVEPFTMYSARHTWASIAYSIGIPKSLINDCLCHVDPDMAVTDIYIKKDWSVLWEANRKVLERFEWK